MLINAIGVDSVVVSWTASQSSCDDVIANYTVTYRLRDGLGAHTSVNTATTSVTICDLVPNAEYTVSVAAMNSMGDMSVHSAESLFVVNMATAPVTVPISPSGPTATPAGTAQGNRKVYYYTHPLVTYVSPHDLLKIEFNCKCAVL